MDETAQYYVASDDGSLDIQKSYMSSTILLSCINVLEAYLRMPFEFVSLF